MDYQALIPSIERTIKDAGQILLTYFQKNNLTRTIKADGSFVTQADKDSEAFLIKQLHALLPEAGFFAEESGISDASKEYQWVIDPLDGTTNFAQGLPYFCISVALTKNTIPVVGVIYNPLLNEFFYAIKGNGAYLNGMKIDCTQMKKQSVNDALIIFAIPYRKNNPFFKTMDTLSHQAYTIRTFGAAALDQAYLAAGRADAIIMQGLSWWDVAAGIVLIEESGGTVSDFKGNPITPTFTTLLGSTEPLYNALRQLVTV